MTPSELAAHLQEAAGPVDRVEITPQGQLAVWVTPVRWREIAAHLKGCETCGFDYFTLLTAIDMQAEGFEIVAHVYSVANRHHVNVKTSVAREDPHLDTISGVWRGADWHERETAEMFGVRFDGHPHLVKLELPEAFDGFPLRKDFPLATRFAKEWPGAKEPEEHKATGGES